MLKFSEMVSGIPTCMVSFQPFDCCMVGHGDYCRVSGADKTARIRVCEREICLHFGHLK